MDPVNEVEFIRSREVNVPYEGFMGAIRELWREGPLTILFAAAVGAAIGGLAIIGAPLITGGAIGMGTLPLMLTTAGASALLTTAFVGTRGFLEGRHNALEKNTLLDHMAELHKGEVAMRGLAVQQEISEKTQQKEGITPTFIKKIIDSGKQGSPGRHAESILAMRDGDHNNQKSL